MQALSRGWQEVGKPSLLVVVRLVAAQRLDLAISIACSSIAPHGLAGLAINGGVRLLVAAAAARSGEPAEHEVSSAACHGQ